MEAAVTLFEDTSSPAVLNVMQGTNRRFAADIASRAGSIAPQRARTFLDIIAQGRARTGRARIGFINRAINLAIRPVSDLAQWSVLDRWSAPFDTLTSGLGDCEDYAIAKYVALTQAGILRT